MRSAAEPSPSTPRKASKQHHRRALGCLPHHHGCGRRKLVSEAHDADLEPATMAVFRTPKILEG